MNQTFTAIHTKLLKKMKKLEERNDVLNQRVSHQEHEIAKLKNKVLAERRKYLDLYHASVVIGDYALIAHLERSVEERQVVIERYQRHYRKFADFYRRYEEAHPELFTPDHFTDLADDV